MVTVFNNSNNVNDYRYMLNYVALNGRDVNPRGQHCVEVRNVVISYEKPVDVLAVSCGRKFNTKLAAYEALCLIAGVSFSRQAVAIAPNLATFLNEDGEFDGAYGPRMAAQLDRVIDKLFVDPDSRQGCVIVWRSWDLSLPTADLACTVYLNFAIRDNKLLMTTHMRSQDLWWGWPYDLVQFTQLQHTMATVLGIDVGEYTHVVDSLHVYTRNADEIWNFTHPDDADGARPFLTGIEACHWGQAKRWALALLTDEDKTSNVSTESELWFANQKLWTYHNEA